MTCRILFVITTLDVGGAEKHLRWLCGGLCARGHEVDVVYLKGEGRLTPDFVALGVGVSKVPLESTSQALRCLFGLASHIRRGRYDLVHTHLLKADALGSLACQLAGHSALVASKHNEEQVLKKTPVALIHGVLTRRARRVIALSDHVLEYVATVGRVRRDRLRRIYYGIDPEPFVGGDRAAMRAALGIGEGTHVALCVARFHPQKDHETLFRAAARLVELGRDFQLLLAGGDPFYDHEARLRGVCDRMGLANHVRFLGIRDDVPLLLAACDVFVLPSLYEGLGLVYLEAMAASRPVLATNGSAIPEVVTDGVTGVLVDVGADKALAAAWDRMIVDPATASRMGEEGRVELLKRFTLPRMIDETIEVYAEVLGRPL